MFSTAFLPAGLLPLSFLYRTHFVIKCRSIWGDLNRCGRNTMRDAARLSSDSKTVCDEQGVQVRKSETYKTAIYRSVVR